MAYIESAFYGDEKSQRNATKVLADKILGTTVDVDVNEKLIPPFEVAEKVEITDVEEKKIRDKAVKACGGADQECIRRTEDRLRQEALTAKQNAASSSATAIKGRRLTVTLVENGVRKRIVIPDGQKFKLENVTSSDPTKGDFQVPSVESIQNKFMILGGLIFSTFIYVFSVAATWTLFAQTGKPEKRPNIILAIPATVIAIFIPYSGYALVFLYFMFNSAINTYIGNVQ